MRRPGVRFWRVVFAASAMLFAAGGAMIYVATRHVGFLPLSSRTTIDYLAGYVGVARMERPDPKNQLRKRWETFFRGIPPDERRRMVSQWKPYFDKGGARFGVHFPAEYICGVAAASGLIAAFAIRRGTNRAAAGCANCGYSLAGLPADAAACPECGGKIRESTAEAR